MYNIMTVISNTRHVVKRGCSVLLVFLYFSVVLSWSIQQRQRHSRFQSSFYAKETRSFEMLNKHQLKSTLSRRGGGGQEAISSVIFWGLSGSKSSSSSNTLLFSEQQSSHWVINDSDLIESIIQANSTIEVDQTLRRAMFGNVTSITLVQQPYALQKEEYTSFSSKYLKHNKLSISKNLNLNVSATLLRRMAHISISEARASQVQSTVGLADSAALREDILVGLVQSIEGQLVVAHRELQISLQDDKIRDNVFALSDILQAFAVLASGSGSTRDRMVPLSMIVVELLDGIDTTRLYSIKPIRLLQCLQALSKLEIHHTPLQHKIYVRLLRPDAISGLPARYLAHGLATFALLRKSRHISPNTTTNTPNDQTEDMVVKMLSRAFMRRLRKKKVIKETTMDDLIRILVATSDLLKLGAMTNMEDEASICGFSCLRRILDLRTVAKEENNAIHLTANQMVDLISSWTIVADRSREDTVMEQLLNVCVDDGVLLDCNMNQLLSIISAIQKHNTTNHSHFTKAVGYRFGELIKQSSEVGYEGVNPKLVSEILRWPILTQEILRPYIDSSLPLFRHTSFLSGCGIAETANFLWFLSSTKTYDEQGMMNIGSRLLEPDSIDESTPKMASRILAAFTSLVATGKNMSSDALVHIHERLFHSHGGHLLSYSLTPAEASSSLYAYAKASYLQDMGIFDHLVGLLASSRRICTSRQLSQCLWSCGKMASWESLEQQNDVEMTEGHSHIPYVADAKLVADELTRRVEELSPADIAQSIWALGRLDIRDDVMMSTFTHQAIIHSSRFSTGQISNILWGIARTGQRDLEAIAKLTYQLTAKDIRPSPIEASSALFSLSKLNWREAVFDQLSTSILEQIEKTNAQSIANALWAYRTVGLPTPKMLLSTWASEKIGLQSLSMLDE